MRIRRFNLNKNRIKELILVYTPYEKNHNVYKKTLKKNLKNSIGSMIKLFFRDEINETKCRIRGILVGFYEEEEDKTYRIHISNPEVDL